MKKTILSIIILFSLNFQAISHVQHYEDFNYLEYELFRNNKSIGYHKYNFIRKNDKDFKDQKLEKVIENDEKIFNAIIKNPKLIERPIVLQKNKGIIARPPELLHDFLL